MENYYGLIELVLVSTIVLGWAFWQLISVNRQIKADKDKTNKS